MDWDGVIERNRIKRIVALLFALATLAERAAPRPLALRMFVHWLLLSAEFAALTLIAAPLEIEACAARDAPNGTGPCDLIRMAVSLRAIAIVLAAGCAAPPGRRERSFRRLAITCLGIFQLGSSPVRLNDTS